MINFRSQDVDGFGDRADIALERDRSQGEIKENQAQELADVHEKVIIAQEFGSSSTARSLQDIILEMVENEVYEKLFQKSDITFPTNLSFSEAFYESLTDACIQLGLSDEEFTPHWQDKGAQIDISLVG